VEKISLIMVPSTFAGHPSFIAASRTFFFFFDYLYSSRALFYRASSNVYLSTFLIPFQIESGNLPSSCFY
jgi:hypothetical protein